ncbi:aminotransferase class V-fold PLP-dependent enzyme [Chryseolinea soli]|uniref:Aminotransferase class V-fold PLP-dependent enzyme n=1 Tax=Chryseolinea soli TaxID=2321403 RepID=A0A385SKC4_9BACT|nr:aminotransferase class V-fold PLP-dependent enzyme [Chryseolinea soli]AYB30717.1 aminotransferase class V-fold PLP-dependent enzyme [Chryseolinea soli]
MLTCKRSAFTLPPRITYLNCGYMSPQLKDAEKVGIRNLRRKRNPAAIKPEDFFSDTELLRQEFGTLIHADDPKRIVVVPSVSYGMANVARNLKIGRGDNMIVAAEQFPSNYYPWQRLCEETGAQLKSIAPPEEFSGRGQKWNERILDAIDIHTKAVALGHVHWVDGTLFDLMAIRRRTREVGAALIIDGTQSVGALPFDVQAFQPDALVCAGYKWLLGPYSTGLAYYGEYFDHGKPIEESWLNRAHSEQFSQLTNYQSTYQAGALRYEVGEHSNFVLVPMLLKSIQQLNRWGVANIQEYCGHISREATLTLRDKGFLIEDEAHRAKHLFGIRLGQHDPEKIKTQLLKNNIYVSFRGNAIRVAPNVYNTEKDLKKFATLISR